MSEHLLHIDSLRKNLLLIPLSPRQELQLQWEAIVDRIYYILILNGTVIPKEKIANLLSPQGKKQLTSQEKMVVGCKQTLDYLYHEWLVNDEPIKVDHLKSILSIFEIQKIRTPDAELSQILDYSQLNTEHPVIQAAVSYIYFYDLFNNNRDLSIFTHLFYEMLLYKQGYDFRRMLSLEKQLINDSMNYQVAIATSIQQQNITAWLEFFAKSVATILKEQIELISSYKAQKPLYNAFLELNTRQKTILNMLNNPSDRITNSLVQKEFNVSQITASRDLSKLAQLGLLLALGKGRSSQYSKV